MNYFIADVNEQMGEFETVTTIRFKAENEDMADKIHKFVVAAWDDDDLVWDENDDCFSNDYASIWEGDVTEIDEHTFNQLGKHKSFPDMTPDDMSVVEDWCEESLIEEDH